MSFRTGRRATRRAPWILSVLLLAACAPAWADTGSLNVSATVLSRSICRFTTGTPTLDFGRIDPTSSATISATPVDVQFFCFGLVRNTTYSMRAGDGLNALGPGLRRMRHATVPTSRMAYTLSLTPASGTIPGAFITQTVTVGGTIVPIEFQNARVGSYSDTVVLELDP